ncbi:DUF551 domain-containing protein [Pasteurella multocida]|uniref:DUF551 domain-containing protein n=2 Tax=Pasteurella multocida TaxID=747 RepID=UPI00094B34DE|nr:DUF551 domain-containing protein [Pasteurella multocida]HDR1832451.1 DUF551 domain-containing protein [Pasteurella multocida]HEH9751981.1 DUF551 domain-containing protein [Pasteurella multocida]HEH9756544.1 DUF551 domain-containing protein [Pasteurella multocida]HEH9758782.1 DUF551 domain-containing protein [Pasteurella multocida]HEH9761008.1 DUF551 domain-containing protein [Pasteurella multocida]
MTEKENKYFAVNIYDENSISFHKTEEEAKKACLNCAEEFHQQCADGQDMQCYEDRISHAIYGVILGKAESKTRELSEEEKQSGLYDGIDCMVELPEIVEFPQDDGWISVKDRLPQADECVLVYFKNKIRDFQSITLSEFIDGEFNMGSKLFQVTHWRPLPQPPKV